MAKIILKKFKLSWDENNKIPIEDKHGIYEVKGNIFYYVNGKLHREDGPMVY